jgi:hypothetical protein
MKRHKSIQNGGMRLTAEHIKKAEEAVSSGAWKCLTWTNTSILLEKN